MILPIFLLIDFSSTFSSRCRPKTDFLAIYWPKKSIFLSLATSKYQERRDSVLHAPRSRVSPTRVPFHLRVVNGRVG